VRTYGYGLQQGWFGKGGGLFKASANSVAENAERAAAGAARTLGEAGNAGTLSAGTVGSAVGGGAGSFVNNYVNWATVIEVLVTNPIAQNLHIMVATSMYNFDLVDDLIQLLQELEVGFGTEGGDL